MKKDSVFLNLMLFLTCACLVFWDYFYNLAKSTGNSYIYVVAFIFVLLSFIPSYKFADSLKRWQHLLIYFSLCVSANLLISSLMDKFKADFVPYALAFSIVSYMVAQILLYKFKGSNEVSE